MMLTTKVVYVNSKTKELMVMVNEMLYSLVLPPIELNRGDKVVIEVVKKGLFNTVIELIKKV